MQILTATRTKSGQFAPGSSGNPGGRPKDEARVAELARSYTSEAIDTLVELMRQSKDGRVRGTAAQALLDRGWAKPKVEVVSQASGGYLEALQAANIKKSATSAFRRCATSPTEGTKPQIEDGVFENLCAE